MVLVNMTMPTSCSVCWALDDYGDYPRCRITEEQRGYNFRIREKRMDKCPLMPIPPHGRLIDGDLLPWRLANADVKYESYEDWEKLCDHIYAAPTIIPADPAEEGE